MWNHPALLDDQLLMLSWEGTYTYGKFCLVPFNTITSYPDKVSHCSADGYTCDPWVWCGGAEEQPFYFEWDGAALGLGYLLPPSARPNSSCFGGQEREWDGLTVLCFFHCFCWLYVKSHTDDCWDSLWGIRPGVVSLRDTCGPFEVPCMRDMALTQMHSAPVSYFSCNCTVCIFLPGGCLTGMWAGWQQEERWCTRKSFTT